jgi:GNAT superfamily N-acetyltransferase
MKLIDVNRHNRKDIQAFLKLPFKIYQDSPQWVPPIMPGERARFKPEFPFNLHSDAAFYLVQSADDQPLGRIAVLEHRPHNDYRSKKDALLYLYEAIDDEEVASALFEAAENWARGRGLNQLLGPKGFMTGDGLGLLVEGFDHPPALGIPYNPAYYPEQWENVGGLSKAADYLSGYVDRDTFDYPERVRRIAEKIAKRRGFHVPVFTSKAEMRKYAEPLMKAYNNAFAPLWAYTPIPENELSALIDRLFLISDPRLMKLVFKGDDVIGFTFIFPDIANALRRSKGELWPLGWLGLLLEQRRTQWLNINGNAILPEYQGLGANAVLYNEIIKALLDSRYNYADLVQVQESNMKMLDDMAQLVPMQLYKRHRVYSKQLD